jgi:hypothetical protein
MMRNVLSKGICTAMVVLLSFFPEAVVGKASGNSDIAVSYEVVGKDNGGGSQACTLSVHLKIKNIGGSAIDKVTAYVAGTRGMVVGFDHIFFGLIERGQTLASDRFEILIEADHSPEVERRGILWGVEYETRSGTAVIHKVSTYLEEDADWCSR